MSSNTAVVIDLDAYRRSHQKPATVESRPATMLMPVVYVAWWFMPMVFVAGYA